MSKISTAIFCDPKLLNHRFNPDAITSAIVPISACFPYDREHSLRSMLHSHDKGQLVYIKSGRAQIQIENRIYIFKPDQMIWIPDGIRHDVVMKKEVDFRAIYFDPQVFPQLPKSVEIFPVSSLIEEIIEALCFKEFNTNWMAGQAFHLQSLLISEIRDASKNPGWPAFPKHARIRQYLYTDYENRRVSPRLNELAAEVGASERTLHRIFVKETGLSYQQWRQQARLMLAIELLSTNLPITHIAHQLDFSSTSAFIEFFKQKMTITPKKFQDDYFKSIH